MFGAGARIWLALLATVVLVGALAPHAAAACADADAQPTDIGVARTALAVDCLTNAYRASVGLPALTTDARLAQAAQDHAADMAARGFYAHTTPDGVEFSARITRAGYAWDVAGENIAHQSTTAREVVSAWVASPPHRANLESTAFTQGGYGVVTSTDGTFWVQEFALPTPPTPAPAASPRPTATPSGAADDTDAAGYDLAKAARSLKARATASRAGRSLRLQVTVPGQRASRTRVTVLVSQRGRVVRRLTSIQATGRSHRLRTRLPKALAGRVVVRVGTTTAVARFG